MKRIILIAVIFFLGACISYADGETNWYASINIGNADIKNEYFEKIHKDTRWFFKNDFNYSINAGYDYGLYRIEADISYRSFDFEKCIEYYNSSTYVYSGSGDQKQISILVNGIWEPINFESIIPYLGVGIGLTKIDWNNVRDSGGADLDDSDVVFTYQFITGLSYAIFDQISIDLSYKYIKPEDVTIRTADRTAKGKFSDQEINSFLIGIRYYF